MYFYHESYHDAYYGNAALEDLRSADRRVDERTYEPIRLPAILNWLAIVTVGLCVIFTAIEVLSWGQNEPDATRRGQSAGLALNLRP